MCYNEWRHVYPDILCDKPQDLKRNILKDTSGIGSNMPPIIIDKQEREGIKVKVLKPIKKMNR